MWKLNDEEGWKKFQKATPNNKDLTQCFKDENRDIDIDYREWTKQMYKKMGICFRKVKIIPNKECPTKNDETKHLMREKKK